MQQIEERVLNYTLGPNLMIVILQFFFSLLKNQQQITFRCVKNGCEYDAKENEGVNR